MRAWVLRGLLSLSALLTGVVVLAFISLRGSLPTLDGTVSSRVLSAATAIERDALGVVTIHARTRADAFFALGFAQAQDRYFQMDLSRRLAAGELAEVFGAVALPQDRRARIMQFRQRARAVLTAATDRQRKLLAAYAAGVNDGLNQLRVRPWEYLLLRQAPRAWSAEDSVLVLYSMWWQLQYGAIEPERQRHEIEAQIEALFAGRADAAADSSAAQTLLRFLYPRGTEWDAPLFATQQDADAATGGTGRYEAPAVPGPQIIDLRRLAAPAQGPDAPVAMRWPQSAPPAPGSNSMAAAGRLTAGGAALVANDMHLTLTVPATWYRVRLRIDEGGRDLNGITLPGFPALSAGSNGSVAWSLTNAYGDWSDVARVDCRPTQNRYSTADGEREFRVEREVISVAGREPEVVLVRDTPFGVLLAGDPATGSCWLLRWLALEPGATNLLPLEADGARSTEAALANAALSGVPQLNFVVGDRDGRIGWTIIGRLPQGTAGASTPAPLVWRDAPDQPRLLDPETGLLWTANARVVDGDAEAIIGGDEVATGSGYALGARAMQLRDGLLALRADVEPADMLRLQLDDRALFLERWRRLLLTLLDEDALKNAPRRAELRRWVERWGGRAAVDSVGYRIVREFRDGTEAAAWDMIVTALGAAGDTLVPPQFEGPLWQLVTEQPPHLLATRWSHWREFLLARVDATARNLRDACTSLERCTWGARNTLRLRHPLSPALPFLGGWLDPPPTQLPGDHDLPRVQVGLFGASERFAVSPGREAEGYFQMPGGQSGHPLSPFYRAGFDDWVHGRPAPFLPGPPRHKLAIVPNRASS